MQLSHLSSPSILNYSVYDDSPIQKVQLSEKLRDLRSILSNERIKTVFQPIIDMKTAEVFCYEALSRIEGESIFAGPAELFQAAQNFHMTNGFEKLCRNKALESARKSGLNKPLCLNICPSIFQHDGEEQESELFRELFKYKDKIILELTERFYIEKTDQFTQAVNFFRKQGFRFAIDDLGSGYMGLKMLSELEPFLVKMSRFLIQDINLSTKKQRLMESVISFCHKINALVVAEGIETSNELETLKKMNVDLGQGYFLGRPSENLRGCHPEAKKLIESINSRDIFVGHSSNLIGSISEYVEPFDVMNPVCEVMERFKKDLSVTAIPVVDSNIPAGIITRNKLYQYFSQKFGFALYYNKPVSKIKDPCLIFDHGEALENVAKKVLERDENSIYDDIVITQTSYYAGIVKIHKILDRITEQKIHLAIQANPLTGLPGNNLITAEIMKRLSCNQLFAVMYVDLDNFKPFNEHFGFEKGDQVIRFLGQLINTNVKEFDPESFVGHVGGDDFIVICRTHNLEGFCRSILAQFDRGIKDFHDNHSVELGYYQSPDRQGISQTYALLSVSIAVTSTSSRVFNSHGHLISVLSELKKRAKNIKGSSYYMDKREE